MKKILLLIALLLPSIMVHGQTDSAGWESIKLTSRDSAYVVLQNNHLAKVLEAMNMMPPRYKLYKTENFYNLIKFDTATGAVWQVQYRMGTTEPMTLSIDASSLLNSWEDEVPGRFELYNTNNKFTFILLDTKNGRTWQVQWSTEGPNERFRERLY